MKEHSRRWHQRVFPTEVWSCLVCSDSDDTYAGLEPLHDHVVKAHGDEFPAHRLQTISKAGRVRRSRPWNECLLCRSTVDGVGPHEKRQRTPLVNESSNKSVRASSAMKHPESERDIDQGSDAPDDSPDAAGLAQTPDDAEIMARHIAAHLQVLMRLTMRLASLQHDVHSDDAEDDSGNSASVEHGDIVDAALTRSAEDAAYAASTGHDDSGMPDADEKAPEMVDGQDDPTIPDAVVDFDGVLGQYDKLPVENDVLIQELIKSRACHAHTAPPGTTG